MIAARRSIVAHGSRYWVSDLSQLVTDPDPAEVGAM